ncbi:MAG: response regulator [Desulfobacterales bacterium]|nr:response regulator [Desulfobacterales bacterium]
MPKKILIVDDEIHIRTLLEQTLEDLEDEFGVTILTASNGEEGLEMIRDERPNIVFLDIMMPKMNGFEVCQAVKQDPNISDIIIILLTAKGQEIDRTQGLSAGAYKYMTKPFDPDELFDLAKELLGLNDNDSNSGL